jgi:1-acyl-sn-glycerol-3-phosphate acyltransferase
MSLPFVRWLRSLWHCLYGLYVLIAFLVLGILAFLLVTVVPGLGVRARREIAHSAARSFFFVAGLRVRVEGQQRLPAGPCVVVANHASYLDGVLLKAFLPARFSFVIKKEFSRVPVAGLLLRRIGSEFVDRFNRHAGGMDARRLMKAADAGQALAFFPEGTFIAQPGLGKFHTGAFVIAARAGVPVVPVAIHGTRQILPSGRALPRPGRIDIHIFDAIETPEHADSASVVALTRQRSRERILTVLDEPDLANSDGIETLAERKSGSHAA